MSIILLPFLKIYSTLIEYFQFSTFPSANIHFQYPFFYYQSPVFIYECPVRFLNIHFFNHESPVILSIIHFFSSTNVHFLMTNIQFYILIKKLETKISPCFEFVFYFRYYRFAISSNNILLIICGLACPFEAFMI